MIKSIQDLSALLELSSEYSNHHEQLQRLKHWCTMHISSDLAAPDEEKYDYYFNLAKEYIEIFLNNLPNDINSTVTLYNGLTPVQYAAYQGYNFFIDSITTSDARPFNSATDSGMTPLHFAATFGHEQTCESLLKHQAQLNTLNSNSQPPLFSALLLPIVHTEKLIHKKEQIFKRLKELEPEMMLHQDSNGDCCLSFNGNLWI